MRTHHCLGCSGSKRFAAPSLRSGASMRSSFAGGRRARLAATYPSRISNKVEALNSALRKLGTQEGLGSQWCNRLPSIAQEVGGERWGRKGLWSVCVFCLLPDAPTFEPALTYEQEDG